MKPKIFGPASPNGPRPRTGHQSIRGRISGPIPMSNSIEDDEFPMRNPGTGIASSTPLEDDPILQRQLQQPVPTPPAASPAAQPFSSVAQSIRTATDRTEIIDVPQTVPEHPGSPSPRPNTPGRPGPSPSEGGGSSVAVSAVRGSPVRYHRANNPSGSNRFSTISMDSKDMVDEAVGVQGFVASNSPPQRKKSTLRSALGKFLRRRKKEGSLSSVSEMDRQSALDGTSQHRSVSGTDGLMFSQPGGLQNRHAWANQVPGQVPPASRMMAPPHNNEPAKRVASMPIHEFDRALRSHSIGPDDITAIESVRNSMSLDMMGSSPTRRRATTATNSRLFTAISGRSRGEEWAGLSPRPASTHGRGSRFTEEDPDEIGRALTSDSNADMGHKRRSRSLSHVDELAQEPRDPRRRSDEIRYWRESYDIPGPLSPLSSLPPNENETEANDYNFDQGRTSMSIAESAAVDHTPQTPPQPFNFGSIASMNEMAGMKITQAATLDERFGSLEARVHSLERVVDQLCHSVPGFKWPFKEGGAGAGVAIPVVAAGGRAGSSSGTTSGAGLQRVPVGQPTYTYNRAAPIIPSVYGTIVGRDSVAPSSRQSVDTTDDNNSAHMSFGEGRTYIDSLHPPSSSATQALSPVTASTPAVPVPGLLRPTSETTVRPAASMPSLGSQCSGEDHSANLAAQLEAERAARQALEAQVRKLSERMNNLSTTMFAMVRDPAKSKSTERLRPQTAASSTTIANSAYLAPISGNTNTNTGGGATKPASASSAVNPSSKAQSIFGKDGSSLASIASSPTRELGGDDDQYSEAFETPREEPGQTPGARYEPFGAADEFGMPVSSSRYAGEGDEDEDEEDLRRKKEARTLSLSQLTMGKGLPTRI
ncbi:hypothetical protein VMCG_01289 [Cytospora schulzeri]|uniref:Uncharacterized protein n=1 Tax=Cytospora schulzeri TaxID=448051 RepID=A0A423X667_9PEZI|nr:hypothetical protein VMCG_01289 [Valsa malicola]